MIKETVERRSQIPMRSFFSSGEHARLARDPREQPKPRISSSRARPCRLHLNPLPHAAVAPDVQCAREPTLHGGRLMRARAVPPPSQYLSVSLMSSHTHIYKHTDAHAASLPIAVCPCPCGVPRGGRTCCLSMPSQSTRTRFWSMMSTTTTSFPAPSPRCTSATRPIWTCRRTGIAPSLSLSLSLCLSLCLSLSLSLSLSLRLSLSLSRIDFGHKGTDKSLVKYTLL